MATVTKAVMHVAKVVNVTGWEEDITVGAFETAEETANRIIANYNATLRPNDIARKLVGIVRTWEEDVAEDEDLEEDEDLDEE